MTLKYEPWGNNPDFDWDHGNLEEIWNHRIRDFEVEQCFENEHDAIPHMKARSQPVKYGDRYVVRGMTHGGRRLTIVVQYLGDSWVRPVTAWDDKKK